MNVLNGPSSLQSFKNLALVLPSSNLVNYMLLMHLLVLLLMIGNMKLFSFSDPSSYVTLWPLLSTCLFHKGVGTWFSVLSFLALLNDLTFLIHLPNLLLGIFPMIPLSLSLWMRKMSPIISNVFTQFYLSSMEQEFLL